MPALCMNAYIVVGPTKLQPRFLRSFDSAIDSAVFGIVSSVAQSSFFGRDAAAGSKRHT